MKFAYALAALPLVAACAQNPASIAPVSMGNARRVSLHRIDDPAITLGSDDYREVAQ